MVKVIAGKEFEKEVLESELPVVVDFFATWCGPCRMMSPVLESLSESMSGVCRFVKVDIDQCMELARGYRIEAVPTLKVFKAGKPVESIVGYRTQNEISDILAGIL